MLLHPLMLALYLWVAILYFMPGYFQKYKAEIVDTEYKSDNYKIFYHDLNGDGVEEITGQVNSPENIHYPMPYTDSASWLMVIDPLKMDFHFPPKRFDAGIGSWVSPVFYGANNKKYIAATIYSSSAKKGIDYLQIKLYDANGKLLKENNIAQSEVWNLVFINPLNENDNSFYLMDNFGNIYQTDTSLRLSLFYKPGFQNTRVSILQSFIDADGDGENEMLFFGGSKKAKIYLLIYRQNLKEAIADYLPESKNFNAPHINIIYDGSNESPFLFLQTGNNAYKIKYRKNPYFLLKYPVYLVGYLMLFLMFWLLQRVQTRYAHRKFEEEKRLAKQQMALSKRQLEPHFMLNTLNNIGQMFAAEKTEDAQYYFGKFASLIHRGLKYADKTETALKEELAFIRDYLVLQQRWYDDLEFIIEADEAIDLDEILIPHSLVYTFVENALKHGLRNKEGEKKLDVFIKRKSDKVIITISDNGIGRKQSKARKTSGTGKGLGIISNIVKSYNKLNKRDISFETFDLDEGAEVRIEV